jgi:hypothetical protein
MTRSGHLPSFVREAMLEDAEGSGLERLDVRRQDALWRSSMGDAEESLLALEDAVSDIIAIEAAHVRLPDSMLTQAPARLERTVVGPPHRYAPFFNRAAELFDLSEDAVIVQLARLQNARQWRWSGFPGGSMLIVRGGPAVSSGIASLFRIDAGGHFPRHQHLGKERVLVLEGSYVDSHGMVQRAGELREWPAGTEHDLKVEGSSPCIFACVAVGWRFDEWWLRALATIFHRSARP